MNLQIQLLKTTLNKYDDNTSFSNYEAIAKKYERLYTTLAKDKKNTNSNKENFLWYLVNDNQSTYTMHNERLKKEVMQWFMSLSLEDRIKVATVENEWYCKIIFQMFNFIEANNVNKFKGKETVFYSEGKEQQQSISNCNSNDYNNTITYSSNNKPSIQMPEPDGNGIIYPANTINKTIIKLHKEKKNKSETVIYNQENLDHLPNEDLAEMNIGNFFYFLSDKDPHTQFNRASDILSQIKFYSVHHKGNFPDCMTISPTILYKDVFIENYFSMCCNNQLYFKNLIKPFYSTKTKHYSYMFPDWMGWDSYYTLFQYIFSLFEQAILIKYLLNLNPNSNINGNSSKKGNKSQPVISSLINQAILDKFFENRRDVINYININYPIEIRDDLLNKTIDVERIYFDINKDETKQRYIELMQTAVRIQSFPSMRNNIKKSNKTKANIGLAASEMKGVILALFENNGNIEFVDKLIYHNIKSLWDISQFVKQRIFEQLVKLYYDKTIEDLLLLDEGGSGGSNKKKGKKGKAANANSNNGKKKDKDIEEEFYMPYRLKQGFDLDAKDNKSSKGLINNNNQGNGNKTSTIKEQVTKEQTVIKFIQKEIIAKIINNAISKDSHSHEVDHIVDFFNKSYSTITTDTTLTTTQTDKDKANLFNSLFINENNNNDNVIININKNINNNININNEIVNNLEYINNNSNKSKKAFTTMGSFNSNSSSQKDKDKSDKQVSSIIQKETQTLKEEDLKTPQPQFQSEPQSQSQIKLEIDKKMECELTETITTEDQLKSTTTEEVVTGKEKEKNPHTETEQESAEQNAESNSPRHKQQAKKKKKQQQFFLYDTTKKRKPKKPKIAKNSMIPRDFHLFSIPKNENENTKRSFYEKLHNDLLRYESFISEILFLQKDIREHCIDYVETTITACFSQANVDYDKDIYGSYATGLMIETSDVDIKIRLKEVLSKEDFEKAFHLLVSEFRKETDTDRIEAVTPISTASVPVIKLVLSPEQFSKDNEKLTEEWKEFKESEQYKSFKFNYDEINKFKIDITFSFNSDFEMNEKRIQSNCNGNVNGNGNGNTNNSNLQLKPKSSVTYAREKISHYPQLRILIRVLKRYFYIKKMNNAFLGMFSIYNIIYLGGLSSYNLFLVVLSYMQYKDYNNDLDTLGNTNLGFLLHDFFNLFSCKIAFRNYLIDVNSPLPYIQITQTNIKDYPPSSIVVLDPLTGFNASKSSYRIDDIQITFYEANLVLSQSKKDYENFTINLPNSVYSFLGLS